MHKSTHISNQLTHMLWQAHTYSTEGAGKKEEGNNKYFIIP
jgi:hypothetical protein